MLSYAKLTSCWLSPCIKLRKEKRGRFHQKVLWLQKVDFLWALTAWLHDVQTSSCIIFLFVTDRPKMSVTTMFHISDSPTHFRGNDTKNKNLVFTFEGNKYNVTSSSRKDGNTTSVLIKDRHVWFDISENWTWNNELSFWTIKLTWLLFDFLLWWLTFTREREKLWSSIISNISDISIIYIISNISNISIRNDIKCFLHLTFTADPSPSSCWSNLLTFSQILNKMSLFKVLFESERWWCFFHESCFLCLKLFASDRTDVCFTCAVWTL